MNDSNVTLKMTPIDMFEDKPRDEKLYAAMQEYSRKEFGEEINCRHYLRVWVVTCSSKDAPDCFQVVAVSALRNTPDCPMFHVTPPTEDKEGMQIAHQARDMMVMRLHGHLEDLGMRGANVLIHVSEKAERYWRGFLNKIKAKPSNRWEMKI